MKQGIKVLCFCGILPILLTAGGCSPNTPPPTTIASLSELSTAALRQRPYRSAINIEQTTNPWPNESFLASYRSDGLRIYTRIDVPTDPPPDDGYPVVIFVHGWAGIERAPDYDFYFNEYTDYAEMVAAYVNAGFVVFVPGWRGHGTVNGVPADGIEFMESFDNGSYLSPAFYAIDVLNLVDGLQSFAAVPLDLGSINLSAHSQGGDVALIVLAVAGENSRVENEINAASIWSGTFPSRFTQVHTYHPMESAPQAFMAGDGTWTGTAVSAAGDENPNFVFGYPPDWIDTVDRTEWTWQNDIWTNRTVLEAVDTKFTQMYAVVNSRVSDINGADFEIVENADGTFSVDHDPRVADAMARIGAYDLEELLTEPLLLQHSDRDFYSLPNWNADLCHRINDAGGSCRQFEYAENTHGLRVSQRDWFSGPDAVAGFETALARDIALFHNRSPAETDPR